MKINILTLLFLTSLIFFKVNTLHHKSHSHQINHRWQNKPPLDKDTVANYEEIDTEHYHLDLRVDFEKKQVRGTQKLEMLVLKDNITQVILDVYEIDVKSVDIKLIETQQPSVLLQKNSLLSHKKSHPHNHHQHNKHHKKTHNFLKNENIDNFEIVSAPENIQAYGQKLIIYLPEDHQFLEGEKLELIIKYETLENQTAIQYLDEDQTATGNLKYLFSQCEAVACRSLAPFQDSPAVKSTYSATITLPQEYEVFMSANKVGEEEIHDDRTKTVSFAQNIEIPSYLLAIVSGELVEYQISERTYVITDPVNLEYSAQVLEDQEDYVVFLEEYLTPYDWGVYKIVLLPSSFPFAGMENPMLTFASPDIITADKEKMLVVIHEIAHSWFGNTITCNTWQDLWLNEGLTTFMEFKGVREFIGEDAYNIMGYNSVRSLNATIDAFMTSEFLQQSTQLNPPEKKYHPDDLSSSIAYDKGHQFALYLERVVGEEEFKGFLKQYLVQFEYKSITSDHFSQYFKHYFEESPEISQIDWEAWLRGTGYPPEYNNFDDTLVLDAEATAELYVQGNRELNEKISNYHFLQKSKFIRIIQTEIQENELDQSLLSDLDNDFDFKNSEHSLVQLAWINFVIGVKENLSDEDYALIDAYQRGSGLGGYAESIYSTLIINGYEEYARESYQEIRHMYHPVVKQSLDVMFENQAISEIQLSDKQRLNLIQQKIRIENDMLFRRY